MKKKRTVRKQFFKLMFALCATFALSIPIGMRAENEVKEKTDANIKGSVVDSKNTAALVARQRAGGWHGDNHHHRCRGPLLAEKPPVGR